MKQMKMFCSEVHWDQSMSRDNLRIMPHLCYTTQIEENNGMKIQAYLSSPGGLQEGCF